MSQMDIDNKSNREQSINEKQEENKEQSVHNEDQEDNKENEDNQDNEEKKEEKEEEKEEPFIYLTNVKNDNLKGKEDQIFTNYKGNFKYCFCILMEKNNSINSLLLKQTLISIGKNLSSLNENINITPEEISLFIFIKEMKNKNKLTNYENNENEEERNSEYIIQEWTMNTENESEKIKEKINCLEKIKIFTINKLKHLYPIKSIIYYYEILSEIKLNKSIIFSTIMTAGVTFGENKLMELISFSYHEHNANGIAVSSIDYQGDDLITKLCSFEKKRFNLYNLNYLNESYTAPISSQLSTITINNKILKLLKEYYAEFKNNTKATIDYHDYNLALYLKQKKCLIKFINDNPGYILTPLNISFYDYQQIYIDNFSGYFGNFFQILSSFKNCDILQVIFLIFQIISIGFELILPSIAGMIIYIIFYAAFKTDDYKISLFFTLLYLILMLTNGYCSLVGKKINKMRSTYFILNILMALLYCLSLVSSIPAMHFANKDKHPDDSGYKFNKAAISVIIILTFLSYIIPIILSFSYLGGNAFLLLIYNLIMAPFLKINYNVAGVWKASGVSGGKKLKERKAIFILLYLLINFFIGNLSLYNFDNKKKANCVMAFGIIYLVHIFVRALAILIHICFRKEETFNNNKSLMKHIIKDLNENGGDDDINSEEKPIPKNEDEEENNENNINNEVNNNKEKDEDNIREVEVDQD